MKAWWKVPLTAALIMLLAVAPALALGEAPDTALAKLRNFSDELATQGVPVDAQALDSSAEGGIASIYGALNDYLYASAEGDDTDFTYALSVLYADLPDELNADDLYARFIRACTGGELDAATDVIAWLRENMVRTSYYGMDAARGFGDYTVVLSASRTNAEETLQILCFVDD